MLFDLKEVLRNPGVREFAFELDLSEFVFTSVKEWNAPLQVSGEIRNSGGVLTLTCRVESDAVCVCDRCGREFRRTESGAYEAYLQENLTDDDNPDIFPVKSGMADLEEIVRTLYVLEAPALVLCDGEDCAFSELTIGD